MAAQGKRIGALTIARAVEMIMPFDPAAFFPETTPAAWAPPCVRGHALVMLPSPPARAGRH